MNAGAFVGVGSFVLGVASFLTSGDETGTFAFTGVTVVFTTVGGADGGDGDLVKVGGSTLLEGMVTLLTVVVGVICLTVVLVGVACLTGSLAGVLTVGGGAGFATGLGTLWIGPGGVAC